MTFNTLDQFVEWLDIQETQKGWTDYRLAKEAKISASVLSKARAGVLPKWDACEAIAHALGVSPISVFRKAGLLPPGPENEQQFDDWKYLLERMPQDQQDELRQIAEMKLENNRKAEEKLRAANRKLQQARR